MRTPSSRVRIVLMGGLVAGLLLVLGCTGPGRDVFERGPYPGSARDGVVFEAGRYPGIEPIAPPFTGTLIPVPVLPSGRLELIALARASATQLAQEAELAAAEANVARAAVHAYPAGVQAGALRRAVLAAIDTPELSLESHAALDRARQAANWIIGVQSNLMTYGGGDTMGGTTSQESWTTVARLARETSLALAGAGA